MSREDFEKWNNYVILSTMKLVFSNLKDSPLNILRQAGYSFLKRDEKTGELSFAKRLAMADYPKFHIYVKVGESGEVQVNLHLDQKAPSYPGSYAHGAEYEGSEVLKKEAEEIKKAFAA